MIDLPLFRYQAIMIDPPWLFENWSEAGEDRNANQHYECMSIGDIADLNVGHHASRDCALFMWATDPLLPDAIRVMEAWGFAYKTVAFTWVKTCRVATEKYHFGPGYWTRANPEMCLLGTNGAPVRLAADVPQLIVAPVREHSRKPDEAYERVQRLVAGPYADIFARQRRNGWDCWGKEADKWAEA